MEEAFKAFEDAEIIVWKHVDLNQGSLPPSTTVCRPRSSIRALS